MSQSDKALVARVERLISGNCRPEDLNQIFLRLRQAPFGRQSLVELGHFVAHPNRDKGICTDRFLDFHTIFPTLMTAGNPIDPANLPEDHIEFLQASFRMLGTEFIASKTGIRQKKLSQLLKTLITRVERTTDGRLAFATRPPQDESKLLECLANRQVVVPAFDDEILISDVWHSLERNGLVNLSQKSDLLARKPIITAFAIATMHQSRLVNLPKSIQATIICGIYEGNLIAMSSMSTPSFPAPVSMPIFKTTVSAQDHCLPELVGNSPFTEWDCAIELNSELKLAPLSKDRPFIDSTIIRDDGGKITIDRVD